MQIDLFNVKEFVELNHLKEVTSPVLFQRGDVPDPNGLVSNEIFGVTTKSRKETFAYINLYGHFFHPHIYKAIRRMFRNIDRILDGSQYYSIDKDGYLVLDEVNGNTGIEWLYTNWDKIKWERKEDNTKNMRDERISMLENFKRDEIFIPYQIVIPAFYRDVLTNSGGGGGTTEDINNLYIRVIRLVSTIRSQGMFDFQFNSTNYTIQQTLVDIYDYFKQKIEKKKGIIRKYLMGKNTDYGVRTVITCATFHANKPDELFVDYEHSSIPISQLCSLVYPFIIAYIKKFFEREVFDTKNQKILYNPATDEIDKVVSIKDPESLFTDKWIKQMIDTFIRDPESRFNKIEVPIGNGKQKLYLAFSGKRMDGSNTSELSGMVNRPMTWTDLLYMACVDTVKDKHALITRYPLLDEFGIFVSKIRVASTVSTVPMIINGELYKWYPNVRFDIPPEKIGAYFIDACQFSNSYLEGIEGDYDGDQCTVKVAFTQEANEECEEVMHKKSNFINANGSNIRVIAKEAFQTFYVMTKDPYGVERPLTKEETEYFVKLKPEDITFEMLVDWFGQLMNYEDKNKGNYTKTKYHWTDTMIIKPGDIPSYHGKENMKTTLGRFIFNKVLFGKPGIDNVMEYVNKVVLAKVFKGIDSMVAVYLRDDKITVPQIIKYTNTRDWLGLQLHGIITTSFTPGVLHVPDSVKELKKKLIEENKEALDNGDSRAMENIENQLIDLTKKELKDDIGMDLYNSGARGSVNNHLKNILLTRGAVMNPVTGKYDIIENSLLDGLAKKDIPTHSNVIVTGSYPKAVFCFWQP